MYKHILVAIDGSETSARALAAALQLARDNGAELQPLYVIDTPPMAFDAPSFDPSVVRKAYVDEGIQVTTHAQEQIRQAGVSGATRMVEASPTGDDIPHCILRAACDFDADLVVLGTHGRRGFRRLVLGSVAEQFLRIAERPVLLVPARQAAEARVQPAASS